MVGRGAGRQAGMFRTASFRTLLRRFRGQATVAGTQSRPAGASRLRRLHSQQATIGDAAAASAGHRFGLFRRYLKPHVMTVAGLSTAGVGLWYMNKKLPQSENDCVEACVVSSDASSGSGASVSEADWVETCVVSSAEWVAEVDWVETGVVSPVVRNQNDCAELCDPCGTLLIYQYGTEQIGNTQAQTFCTYDGGKRLLAWGHFVPSVVRHMDPEDANECIPIYSALFDERGIEEKNLRRQWRRRRRLPPRRGPRVRVYLGPRKLSPSSSAVPWRWTSPSLPSTGCRSSRTRRLARRRSWRSTATRRAARAKQAMCTS